MEVDMTATQAQVIAGLKSKVEGHEYEEKYTQLYDGDIWENLMPRSKVRCIFEGETTTPKTDGFICINTLIETVSIKNSTGSTQIQVCSLNRFAKKFNLPQSVYEKLQMFLGAWPEVMAEPRTTSVPFLKKCVELGFDASKLNKKWEITRSRLLAKNITNFQEVIDWFYNNREAVARFIFKESFVHPSETDAMPTKVVYALEKNDIHKTKSFIIDDIVSRTKTMVTKADVKINSKASSTIRIGPFTMQMKGSQTKKKNKNGKFPPSTPYHDMQFNCTRADLETYLKL